MKFLAPIASAIVLFTTPHANAEGILFPDDSTMTAIGEIIYDAECAACHGTNLEGQENWRVRNDEGRLPAPPHDVSGHTWHHPDIHLFQMTKFGIQVFAGPEYPSDMPAYEGVLTDPEIIAVLSYIKSTWPEDIRDRHDHLNRQAAQ